MDVILETKIKDVDDNIARATAAVSYGVGKTIDIQIRNDVLGGSYGFAFTYTAGDNVKLTGKNFLRQALIAFIRAYEYGMDTERERTDINAVTPAGQDVPDGIVE